MQGFAHTESSRAKISAANKGKTPWNVGRQWSEETKQKIALKTKEAAIRKKTAMRTILELFDQFGLMAECMVG